MAQPSNQRPTNARPKKLPQLAGNSFGLAGNDFGLAGDYWRAEHCPITVLLPPFSASLKFSLE